MHEKRMTLLMENFSDEFGTIIQGNQKRLWIVLSRDRRSIFVKDTKVFEMFVYDCQQVANCAWHVWMAICYV